MTSKYDDLKSSHLDTRVECLVQGITFTPMIMEAVGGGCAPGPVLSPAHLRTPVNTFPESILQLEMSSVLNAKKCALSVMP